MKLGLRRRRAALPPIATVLIVIAAVVAAGLVAWFLYSTTARAARTAMLSVVGVPTLYADGSLYLTVENDGTADVPLADAVVVVVQTGTGAIKCNTTGSLPASIPAGGSANMVFNCGRENFASIPDGALAKLQAGGYEVSFAVAKPG